MHFLTLLTYTAMLGLSLLAAACATIAVLAIVGAFAEPIMNRIFSSDSAAMLGRASKTERLRTREIEL